MLSEDGVAQHLENVGVFVLWTGAMADLPMRCKLYKNLQWSALRACDQCTITGAKNKNQAVKFLGYGSEHFRMDLQQRHSGKHGFTVQSLELQVP
jgi:hypothetical protein